MMTRAFSRACPVRLTQRAIIRSSSTRPTVPDSLIVNARTAENEIMGVRHKDYPIHGVQFHPESILTRHGKDLLANFLRISEEFTKRRN